MTGQGRVDLDHYNFLHYVMGQVEGVEQAVKPTIGGFQKRFHMLFPPSSPFCDPDQPCLFSKALLRDTMSWMGEHALPVKQRPHCDPFALSIFRAALGGVQDFLDEHPALEVYFRMKVQYADTDILKVANVMRRMVCCSLSMSTQDL